MLTEQQIIDIQNIAKPDGPWLIQAEAERPYCHSIVAGGRVLASGLPLSLASFVYMSESALPRLASDLLEARELLRKLAEEIKRSASHDLLSEVRAFLR